MVKQILEVGENLGKPGRPFIVTVQMTGYFAKPESKEERKAKLQAIREKNRAEVRIVKKVSKPKPPKKAFAEDGNTDANEAQGASDCSD